MLKKGFTPLETGCRRQPSGSQGILSLTGFTLVEFIILALITGILASVAVADLASSVSMAKIEAARFKMKSDIIYAQSLAVTQQINHGLVFDPANDNYSLYRNTTDNIVNDPLTGGAFTVSYAGGADLADVDLASTSFGSPTTDRVEFNNLGIPSDGAANLTIDGEVAISYKDRTAVVGVTKNTGKVN